MIKIFKNYGIKLVSPRNINLKIGQLSISIDNGNIGVEICILYVYLCSWSFFFICIYLLLLTKGIQMSRPLDDPRDITPQ